MTRRRASASSVVLGMAVAAGLVAEPATAQTGGMPIPEPVGQTTGGTGYGKAGTRSIRVSPTAMRDQAVYVRGTFPRAARRRVVLQRFDPERGWRNERRGRVRSTTRFRIRWKPRRSGKLRLRVVRASSASRSRSNSAPVAKISVYRPLLATYFGPGLYGRKTACGQVLTPVLQGVAHKTLPCGTRVALMFNRREVVVPVVDRGPFNGGYTLDLTQGTADSLAFSASGEIGYIRLPS
jgi:rare lipoprotein A